MFGNLESLKRFLAVIEYGTMHRAAIALNITQPALTRTIRVLEDAAGAALFERRARGVHLTAFGEKVSAQARHLLREAQLAESEVQSFREGERGTFRIAAAPVWMSVILPSVLADLHAKYPSIGIQLKSGNYEESVQALQNGDCDAFFGGFQKMDALPSFLQRKTVFRAKLQILLRKGHPILERAKIGPSELLDYPWIAFQSDTAYLDTVRQSLLSKSDKPLTASVQCSSMLTALELLRHGDYLAPLPSSFLKSFYGDGLTAIDTGFDSITFASGPIFRRSLMANAAFSMLIEKSSKLAEDLM